MFTEFTGPECGALDPNGPAVALGKLPCLSDLSFPICNAQGWPLLA
jgi:hypothetical protein